MDEIVLVVLFSLFIILGAILGYFAFAKARKLERQLAQIKSEFAKYLSVVDPDYLESDGEAAVIKGEGDVSPTAKAADTAADVTKAEIAKQQAPRDKAVPDGAESVKSRLSEQDKEKPGTSVPFWRKGTMPGRDLEETIGSLWAVWVGGLALALGAVFLVKFSIDRGLLGPGMRILLGALFSALLIGLGEWSRRRGQAFSFTGFANANIPAILTAAGTMGAFVTIYAAYELYQMLPPLLAFIALGVVAVATSFAALLHGPLLAVLGVLASFAAPLLVTTANPSLPGLSIYILTVSASGFFIGRLRLWKWLAVTVACGLIIYGFILHTIGAEFLSEEVAGAGKVQADRLVIAAFIIAAWCMISYVFVISLYEKSASLFSKIDKAASILSAVMLALILASTLLHPADIISTGLLLGVIIGPFMLAYFYSASRTGIYAAMVVSSLGYLGWSIDIWAIADLATISDVDTLLTDFRVRGILSMFIWVGVVLAATSGVIGFIGARHSASRTALAIGGAFLPLLFFCINYIRVADFSLSWSYAFVALAMFAGFLGASNYIYNRISDEPHGRDGAAAAYSIAAFVALTLSVSLVLEKAALTIALALLVPIIAYVYSKRSLPALRPLTVFASLLWIGRVIWDPTIAGGEIGTMPIFNWLTYGYGIPTAGFALATWLLGASQRDRWLEAMEAITLAAFVATLGLVGLHAIDPVQVFTAIDTLEETALIAIIGGGVALGLLAIKRTQSAKILNLAVTALGFLAMASAAIGLLVVFNPWFSYDEFGDGWILNSLLFGYVFPALVFLALGWFARTKRSISYVNGAFALSALLIASWVNLTIRHIYHPLGLHRGITADSELYTYSIVWLLIGIAVLVAGILSRTKRLRMVSVGILLLVVAKVFLIDMAGLEGILRALSFIGLGATLIGIGLVYQRVLSKPDFKDEEPEAQ